MIPCKNCGHEIILVNNHWIHKSFYGQPMKERDGQSSPFICLDCGGVEKHWVSCYPEPIRYWWEVNITRELKTLFKNIFSPRKKEKVLWKGNHSK